MRSYSERKIGYVVAQNAKQAPRTNLRWEKEMEKRMKKKNSRKQEINSIN